MTKTTLLISAVVAGLMTAGLAVSASADDAAAGKCYGIAKAGQNACASATGSHACKGQAKTDNEPGDFVLLATADCEKAGGKTTAPAAK
jgi:uncharacterized membrane protein